MWGARSWQSVLSQTKSCFQRSEVSSQGSDQRKRSDHVEEHEFLGHQHFDQLHSFPKIADTIFLLTDSYEVANQLHLAREQSGSELPQST